MRTHVLAALSLLLPACAPTAHERLGDVARYAPAYAGYVMGGDADPVILRDPVTYEKIRCREDLERVAPTLAEAMENEVHDRYWRRASDLALGPFTVVSRGAMMVGTGMLFPDVAVTATALAPGRRELYTRARDAYLAGRLSASRDLFQAVLLGRDNLAELSRPWLERSVYYLGTCDEALHRDREAGDELRRFLTTASSPDEARYRDAEQRLSRIDPGAITTCGSREALTLAWRRSP